MDGFFNIYQYIYIYFFLNLIYFVCLADINYKLCWSILMKIIVYIQGEAIVCKTNEFTV